MHIQNVPRDGRFLATLAHHSCRSEADGPAACEHDEV